MVADNPDEELPRSHEQSSEQVQLTKISENDQWAENRHPYQKHRKSARNHTAVTYVRVVLQHHTKSHFHVNARAPVYKTKKLELYLKFTTTSHLMLYDV